MPSIDYIATLIRAYLRYAGRKQSVLSHQDIADLADFIAYFSSAAPDPHGDMRHKFLLLQQCVDTPPDMRTEPQVNAVIAMGPEWHCALIRADSYTY
jgi:hypothetical protein